MTRHDSCKGIITWCAGYACTQHDNHIVIFDCVGDNHNYHNSVQTLYSIVRSIKYSLGFNDESNFGFYFYFFALNIFSDFAFCDSNGKLMVNKYSLSEK